MLSAKQFQMKMQKTLQLPISFQKCLVQMILLIIVPIQFFSVQILPYFIPINIVWSMKKFWKYKNCKLQKTSKSKRKNDNYTC